MSPFTFLIHAHDHVWRDRRIPLEERAATCDLLWAAAIRVHLSKTHDKETR